MLSLSIFFTTDSVVDLIPFHDLLISKTSPPIHSIITASFDSGSSQGTSSDEEEMEESLKSSSHQRENGRKTLTKDSSRTQTKHPTTHQSGPSKGTGVSWCRCIVPKMELKFLLEGLVQKRGDSKDAVSDRTLQMLLLAVLGSVSTRTDSQGTFQVDSTFHLLQGITTLFEEVISLWLQTYNDEEVRKHLGEDALKTGAGKSISYNSNIYIARVVLRLWVVLCTQVLQSSLTPQQLSEIGPLLYTPLATLSKACYNLQQAWLFQRNECLDHDFTLIVLETLYTSLHVVNLHTAVPLCSASDYHSDLKETLTDGCHEWFTYLCSKLHGISTAATQEDSSTNPPSLPGEGNDPVNESPHANWLPILNYSHKLLTFILEELIITSSHINSYQKAAKLSLASAGTLPSSSLSLPFQQPVTYDLQVATGFDKLTLRLSKMAQLLLDMFKSIPLIQVLSLQLLSETANDTVDVISKFLTNIADPAVRLNPEVFDLYLELLENVWFRLSAEYRGSSSLWNKLSNYSTVLMESKREIVSQVIYHIQCLFGHNSATLKSELTKHVIIPFHVSLMSKVKMKCYKKTDNVSSTLTSSPTRASFLVQPDTETDLDSDERIIISLFLKLLFKVASNRNSFGAFASEGTNIYSLFLLFPLEQFRSGSLAVIEECLKTLQRSAQRLYGGGSPDFDSPTSPEARTVGMGEANIQNIAQKMMAGPEEAAIQNTILQILLSVAFSFSFDKIPDRCLSIAEGHAPLTKYGIKEVDHIHRVIQNKFEHMELKQLLVSSFVRYLRVITDIWRILAQLISENESTVEILMKNNISDVISILAPSLGTLLSRVEQRKDELLQEEGKEGCVDSLRECSVMLLSHLFTIVHYLQWRKADPKVRNKWSAVEMHLRNVNWGMYMYVGVI